MFTRVKGEDVVFRELYSFVIGFITYSQKLFKDLYFTGTLLYFTLLYISGTGHFNLMTAEKKIPYYTVYLAYTSLLFI